MNKKQTIAMLNDQADKWNAIYTTSKAHDAGLVLSVIESLICAVTTGNQYAENEAAGMTACHGSPAVRAAIQTLNF